MPTPQSTFDPTALAQLACPACHGDLRLEDLRLICSSCSRKYPIVDGIPALIVERAESM
ncbi:MAG TPA: Trm112 family protein [Terracidiphilus sp.]|nr:Trm112 family protein [Terracidiphilus sp.]